MIDATDRYEATQARSPRPWAWEHITNPRPLIEGGEVRLGGVAVYATLRAAPGVDAAVRAALNIMREESRTKIAGVAPRSEGYVWNMMERTRIVLCEQHGWVSRHDAAALFLAAINRQDRMQGDHFVSHPMAVAETAIFDWLEV